VTEETPLNFARGDVISRKYEIEEQLGIGTFGGSWLARHIASGRHVVIKFLKPELLKGEGAADKLKDGFNRAKNIRHANLIRYGEIGEHNGLWYITEEYFKSENLRRVIDDAITAGTTFTLLDSCQIVIKVLEAVQAGHEAGIVHRDLKPENILVTTQRSGPGGSRVVRTIKVTDLGVPDFFAPELMGDRYDSAGDTSYLAPELASYSQAGKPQADVYSVGVLLYELLCGQVPKGTFFSPTQVRDDLPSHVDQVVELALSPEPGDRYPSAHDMILDIKRALGPDAQEVGSGGTNRGTIAAVGVALLAVLGVGGYFYFTSQRDPMEQAKLQDEVVRRQVQAANPIPSESEIKAMLAKHPDMIYVPSGTFIQGRLAGEDPSLVNPAEPLRSVTEVPAYFMDRYEFPNRAGQAPVGKVIHKEAAEACEKVGKRLCSALEWEKACKGPSNQIYSYGDTHDPTMCGGGMEEAYKAGERTDCMSPYGAYDLSGGFREWTSTPAGKSTSRFLAKGGMRGNAERGTRCAFFVDENMDFSEGSLTFRCCLDADK
jgi:serine/threonine protein kinase